MQTHTSCSKLASFFFFFLNKKACQWGGKRKIKPSSHLNKPQRNIVISIPGGMIFIPLKCWCCFLRLHRESRDTLGKWHFTDSHDPAPPMKRKEGKQQKANCFRPKESPFCLNLSHPEAFVLFTSLQRGGCACTLGPALALQKGVGMESGKEDGWILNCF